MDIRILEVSLGDTLCGHLFLYGKGAAFETLRFVPAEPYVVSPERPTLSLAYTSTSEEEARQLLRDVTSREFNGYKNPRGQDTFLPAWFQNLLPEGAFLRHIAQLRNCAVDDHFEILAACGKDLPGAVTVRPAEHDAGLLQTLVTQGQDALEMSVIALPMHEGFSLSGVQPKLSVNEKDGRYVARTRLDSTTRIIAKLPAVGFPRMPEVEHTSMSLARMAGANVCETKLVPLSALEAEHDYDLGDPDPETTMFLAVTRYDRQDERRIHAEDFAQIFSVMPDNKYSKEYSYAQMMGLMLMKPSLGEEAVFELARRLTVNELLGNADAHLKNIGIYYPRGNVPELPPAYDVVSQYALNNSYGHALFLLPEALSKEQL
ncbi:type II toxin-antitoxin system HipA family toxin, partial [Nostoc sp. CHAB 5834]|nr:type II toxin-antitoxin system HipA family toxin [Nostoc sp. CHAB 5834]